MIKSIKLDETWIRASVLGATWAASEIILGSFLHNLHIPFKGNILTAIGLILLIAAAYRWKENGLFWRSGLICALLKTMSPSAMIFGPMIAIFMESLLFGASVSLLGRNAAGFIVGSALAQSWVLFQKLFNLLVFYGFNIVSVYTGILKFAEKQLNLAPDLFWTPIFLLLGLYMLFGAVIAVIGMTIGRNSGKEEINLQKRNSAFFQQKDKSKETAFQYSPAWLLVSLLMIVGTLAAMSLLPIFIWLPISVTLITLWVIRYKRAMRQLSRPRFWISFLIITILAAITISYMSGDRQALLNGFVIGFEMNVRAAVVILGFSVLGTELYNPKIRYRLQNSIYRNLNEALEIAFQSLPHIFSHLPDARTFLTKPGTIIRSLIILADERVNQLKQEQQSGVYIITGHIEKGKTRFMRDLAEELKGKGIAVAGFYAARVMEEDVTTGYDLVSLHSGKSIPWLRVNPAGNCESENKYHEIDHALSAGKQLLSPEMLNGCRVVFIDEIGRYELNGKGWAQNLKELLSLKCCAIVIAVRTSLLEEVTDKFGIRNYTHLPVGATSATEVAKQMLLDIDILHGDAQ